MQEVTSEQVNNLIDDEFINDEIRVILENHLPRLKELAKENVIPVTPAEAYKYDYDYYNLLRYKNVDYRLHWLTMRCNDRIDPNASCIGVKEIRVPPMDEVKRLIMYHKAMKSKGML